MRYLLLPLVLCWVYSSYTIGVAAQTTNDENPKNGTYAVCPQGSSFNATWGTQALNGPNNLTVSATGSCRQPQGSDSWVGNLTISAGVGNSIQGTCNSIFLDSPSEPIPETDEDYFVITSCNDNNGTTPIVTAASYNLSNGTVVPAGYQSDLTTLSYVVVAQVHTSNGTAGDTSFVYFADVGWYDVAAQTYTSAPDPDNSGMAISNCLGISPQFPYEDDCAGGDTCSIAQCPT